MTSRQRQRARTARRRTRGGGIEDTSFVSIPKLWIPCDDWCTARRNEPQPPSDRVTDSRVGTDSASLEPQNIDWRRGPAVENCSSIFLFLLKPAVGFSKARQSVRATERNAVVPGATGTGVSGKSLRWIYFAGAP